MRIFGVSLLTFVLTSSLSGAGTVGTLESEIENMENEIAQAQNERDRVFLNPKMSSDAALLKSKEDALAEKKRALSNRLREVNSRPKAKYVDPKDYRPSVDTNARDDSPEGFEQPGTLSPASIPAPESAPRAPESAPKEQTVLSGDHVKSEIVYIKKKKGLPAKPVPSSTPTDTELTPVTEPSPSGTPTSEGGLSEIQYPKKKPAKKPALDTP